MTKRSTKNQTCHDYSVLRRAVGLKTNGWKVKADVPGFTRPSTLNGSRPDIIATKGKYGRIIEVETKDSRKRDRQQHKNLRNYAKSHKNFRFMMRTCRT